MPKDKTFIASIAAASTYIIFGFTFLATRVALDHTSPSILLSLRFIISFLCMSLMLVIGVAKVNYKGKPILKLLALGFCQPVAYFTVETLGIQYTNSSFAGIIISLIPISATLLSIVILKEKVPPKKFLWIFCSIAGVVILSVLQGSNGEVQIKGIFFMLLAVLAASMFSILSKSTSEEFSAFERSYIMMSMGCAVFVSFGIFQNGSEFIPEMTKAITDTNVMMPVLYLSVISSVIAFLCLNYAMSYLEVSKATSFTNVQPVISLFAGVVFLHEPISFVHILACAMILTGVYMVTKKS